MSTRYTRRDAILAFGRLASALGKRIGHYEETPDGSGDPHLAGGKWRTVPGAWSLDYAAPYGGYVVEEIDSEQGRTGVSPPLGDTRRTAREFCDVVNFALRVLEEAKVSA